MKRIADTSWKRIPGKPVYALLALGALMAVTAQAQDAPCSTAATDLKPGAATAGATLGDAIPCSPKATTVFKTVASFNGTLGSNPKVPPFQGTKGTGYGTTFNGGTYNLGTIYGLTTKNVLKSFYSFCMAGLPNCADGANPAAGVVLSTNGFYYGTTQNGGVYGQGTVFQMTGTVNSATPTTIYSFCAQNGCPDGQNPEAALVLGPDGNLYGTTFGGGANGSGTVFQVITSGTSPTLTTLYNFCSMAGCADGANPDAPMVLGSNGNLYGTTSGGGNGLGTVFKMTLSGILTPLHSFNGTDGEMPWGLVLANDGNFYGTTLMGGSFSSGTLFQITPAGNLTTKHNFCSETNCTSGGTPLAGLTVASDGRHLYGTASTNGASGHGTIFSSTLNGTTNAVHSFCAPTPPPTCPDGEGPNALIQATNGLFYGTTFGGGAFGDGTIFTLNAHEFQFVETVPAGAAAGSPVIILGPALLGATSVTFSGTPATFTVVDNGEITTTVPSGATNGTVEVVTPTSTFTTVVPFLVLP